MFCFAWLSISVEMSREELIFFFFFFFYFWLNCLFNIFVKEQFNQKCVYVFASYWLFICVIIHTWFIQIKFQIDGLVLAH